MPAVEALLRESIGGVPARGQPAVLAPCTMVLGLLPPSLHLANHDAPHSVGQSHNPNMAVQYGSMSLAAYTAIDPTPTLKISSVLLRHR